MSQEATDPDGCSVADVNVRIRAKVMRRITKAADQRGSFIADVNALGRSDDAMDHLANFGANAPLWLSTR